MWFEGSAWVGSAAFFDNDDGDQLVAATSPQRIAFGIHANRVCTHELGVFNVQLGRYVPILEI